MRAFFFLSPQGIFPSSRSTHFSGSHSATSWKILPKWDLNSPILITEQLTEAQGSLSFTFEKPRIHAYTSFLPAAVAPSLSSTVCTFSFFQLSVLQKLAGEGNTRFKALQWGCHCISRRKTHLCQKKEAGIPSGFSPGLSNRRVSQFQALQGSGCSHPEVEYKHITACTFR